METVALVIIAATIVMGFTDSAIAEKETGVIHVGGKVLCQDCTQGWNEWAHGGNPIKGCKVSITCMDERSRVVYYGSDMTDELGQFDIIVNKYINGKKLNTKLCWVRLVSSPHPTCNILTDFAGGRRGVKLSLPATLVYRDQTEYTLGPFYFTNPLCDEPDTNNNSKDSQGTHY
ncbi:pistil-specific extensin-like protein [Juglans microcarpa x Juglans regia]|uniref:pistil-specific extensin-like protein n=1 Tax=Juglans microcarpa x Juglans regia TaxID=2249226 RepID=UPI001B7DA721|nr:pistil-specific extensin-like protein [Juglans microcarpa x Juglans regia]